MKTIKDEDTKEVVGIHLSDGDEDPETDIELFEKIKTLERYIKKTKQKVKWYQLKLEKERSIKENEKRLVKEGMKLLNLEKKKYNG